MNLVKSVNDQLSSDATAKLCSALGVDVETLESGVAVAVPSILAGLAGLAADEEGVRKLTRTLGGLDDSMFGNFDRMLSRDTNSMVQKGRTLWSGLFGQGLRSNLATAVSRFTGLGAEIAADLLEYLTPLILGRVASQWQNQGGTPEALKRLFGSQQRYIEDALPSGFSLDDIRDLPLMDGPRSAAIQANAPPRVAAKSLSGSLIPLVLVIAMVILLWSYLRNRVEPQEAGARPAVEDADQVVAMKPVASDTTTANASQWNRAAVDWLKGFDEMLGEVRDAPTVLASLPGLQSLNDRIDSLRATRAQLPEVERTPLDGPLEAQIDDTKRQANEVLAMTELNDQLRAVISAIVRKLDNLSVVKPAT